VAARESPFEPHSALERMRIKPVQYCHDAAADLDCRDEMEAADRGDKPRN
jgi:hypothetical protein